MNVFDISHKDVTKTYSKTYSELKTKNWVEYNDKVKAQRIKLERGVFAHKGNFYFAKFEVIDLTERLEDDVLNMTTTICRKVKFVWSYVFLK